MMWGPWSQLRYGRDTHDRLGPRALCLRPRRNHEDLRDLLDVPRVREAGDRAAVPDELSHWRGRRLGVRAEAGRGTTLAVISQQIVPGDESADRWLTIKGAVPTMPIVVVQPTGQGHRAAGRGGIGRAVGPF